MVVSPHAVVLPSPGAAATFQAAAFQEEEPGPARRQIDNPRERRRLRYGGHGMAESEDLSSYIVSGSAGDFIFEEGDEGAAMFIIQDGEVEILRSHAGELRTLAVLRPGEFFGEASLFEKSPREVSARARTSCKLIKIDPRTFDRILRENPAISVSMLRQLSRRWREQWAAALAAQVTPPGPATAADRAGATEGSPSTTAPQRRAILVHEPSGAVFPLDPDREIIVGRPDPAAGFVPDVDLAQFDPRRSLSRRHARLLPKAGSYYVREEMGTNGTFVNNVRVKGGLTVKVNDGDQIRFGLVQTVFRLSGP